MRHVKVECKSQIQYKFTLLIYQYILIKPIIKHKGAFEGELPENLVVDLAVRCPSLNYNYITNFVR